MLGTRVIAGAVMIGVTLVILVVDQWTAPWFPFWLIFSVAALHLAARELVGLLQNTDAPPAPSLVLGGTALIVVSNWAPHVCERLLQDDRSTLVESLSHDPVAALAWPFLAFVGLMMGSFLHQAVLFEKPGRTIAIVAGTVFALAYIGLLGSFTIQLRWLTERGGGLLPLVYLIAAAKGADVGAYLVGRMIGRRKLWPTLSPNKTVEGALGGLALSVGASLLISRIARVDLALPGLEPGPAVAFGLIIGAAGQIGDLMESLIKRDCRRKDASSAVPGFGGVLDVLDSLLFAGPAAYLFWLWVGP